MATYSPHSMLLWIMLLVVHGSVCDGGTHQQLRDKLMQHYGDVLIRPVKDTSTTTTVTIRPLFQNLIDMDIKNQHFTIDCWIKMVWTDEFLTWNPLEFNGTKEIFLPAGAVWLPDITLYENVDLRFQRFKPDTVVEVDSIGTVKWFVPTIFVSACPIRVTWYPFDIQVCNMTFGSFAYNGNHLQLIPATNDDSNQTRFLENGVWDMLDVNKKQLITHFTCCETPTYDVQYRLLFKRRPNFYIKNLIVPVILLSILSTFVFYLPPESGEKVTLSITNLLALVVFEQTIAATMPPSGGPSPVIEAFFLSMITIVAMSVIATIVVIHMNSIAHRPPPGWAIWLLLQKLPPLVCLDGIQEFRCNQDRNKTKSVRRKFRSNSTATPVKMNNGVHVITKSNSNNSDTVIPPRNGKMEACHDEKDEKQNLQEWKLVALVVDRYLMVVFSTATVVITVTLFVAIIIGSNNEHLHEMDILLTSWSQATERTL